MKKLYDDLVESAEIDYSTKLGDRKAFELMDYEPAGSDNTAILFSCWTTLLTQLMVRGWKHSELIKEVKHYKKIADSIKEEEA